MLWAWEKKTGTADARGQGVRAIAVAAWQTTFLSERLRLIRRTVALYRIRSSSARGGRVTMSVHVADRFCQQSAGFGRAMLNYVLYTTGGFDR